MFRFRKCVPMFIPLYFVYTRRVAAVEMSILDFSPEMSGVMSVILPNDYRFKKYLRANCLHLSCFLMMCPKQVSGLKAWILE